MKSYYSALDGFRAIAVGLVLLVHAGSPYPMSGGVGVDMFFVLSGFLITGILSDDYDRRGFISVKTFYIRRFLRLMPCLVLTVFLFMLLSAIFESKLPGSIATICLTYTANWARALWNYPLGAMGHCWSLGIEEQFYLIWPWVIILLESKVKPHKHKLMVLLGLFVACSLYRVVSLDYYSVERIHFGLDTHMDGLILGSVFAYIFKALRSPSPLSDNEVLMKILSYMFTPLACLGLFYVMHKYAWWHDQMVYYGYTIVAFSAAIIILDLVYSRYSMLSWVLRLRPLVFIGKISYGIYLLHLPIFEFSHLWMHAHMQDAHVLYKVFIKFALTLVAAIVSYYAMERKFLRLRDKFES